MFITSDVPMCLFDALFDVPMRLLLVMLLYFYLQVNNYGIGGHFDLHLDTFQVRKTSHSVYK